MSISKDKDRGQKWKEKSTCNAGKPEKRANTTRTQPQISLQPMAVNFSPVPDIQNHRLSSRYFPPVLSHFSIILIIQQITNQKQRNTVSFRLATKLQIFSLSHTHTLTLFSATAKFRYNKLNNSPEIFILLMFDIYLIWLFLVALNYCKSAVSLVMIALHVSSLLHSLLCFSTNMLPCL